MGNTFYKFIFSLFILFYLNSTTKANILALASDTTITIQTLNSITYTGNPVYAVVGTNPTGQLTTITYNGSTTAPKDVGTYKIEAHIEANPTIKDSATLIIKKASATISFSNLLQTFDGTPKQATVSSTPDNLKVKISYNGDTLAPSLAGKYGLKGEIVDKNYTGVKLDTFGIKKAKATVITKDINYTYTDSPQLIRLETVPKNLNTSILYNNSPNIPSLPGTYSVRVNIQDNDYEGDTAIQMIINKAKANIEILDTIKTYNRSIHQVKVYTTPENLKTKISYDKQSVPPLNAGTYHVKVEIDDPKYQGFDSAKLRIDKAYQVLHFTQLQNSMPLGIAPFRLNASSTSGLKPTYESSNPLVASIKGDTLSLLTKGITNIIIKQEGDSNHLPASELLFALKVLSKYRNLSGEVKNLAGETISKGDVRLVSIDTLNEEAEEFARTSINNDKYSFLAPDGMYTIQYLAPDPSKYLNTYLGGSVEWENAERFHVDSEDKKIKNTIASFNPQNPSAGSEIKGKIVKIDKSGNEVALENIALFLLFPSKDVVYDDLKTDINGEFKFDNIASLNFELQVDVVASLKDFISPLIEMGKFSSLSMKIKVHEDQIVYETTDTKRVLGNKLDFKEIQLNNPVKDYLELYNPENRKIRDLKILDMNSNLIKVITSVESKIPVLGLKKGIYILSYFVDGKQYSLKFLKR